MTRLLLVWTCAAIWTAGCGTLEEYEHRSGDIVFRGVTGPRQGAPDRGRE